MNWFFNMRLAAKLTLAFVVVLALTLGLGVFSLDKLAAVRATTVDMAQNWLPSVRVLGDIQYHSGGVRRSEFHLSVATDDQDKAKTIQLLESERGKFDASLQGYKQFVSSPEEQRYFEAIQADAQAYFKGLDRVVDFTKAKQLAAAQQAVSDRLPEFNKLTSDINEDVELNNKGAAAADKESLQIYSAARLAVIAVLVGAVALGLVIALLIARLISRPVQEAANVASYVARGDLTQSEIKVRSTDETGLLAKSINDMQANLRNIVRSIAENSQNVANASEEFSSVSQQITANSEETSAQANAVSAATEEVNRNLQTVATATEEMSASISEIAKNATEAAKVAASAMTTANETNTIVSKLGESSAEIGQVIKVITSIAQKTDLLALNATVEAARAGEVGAGFAVVANEVKELAKQTSTATEDISRKIEAIQTDTKAAVQAISAISGIISQVNQISGTIAAAVEEQSATTSEMSRNLTEAAKGAGEVGQNIHGVAQAAQNTSQGATDSLKAAQQLAKMSTQLRGLVEQFRLEKSSSSFSDRRGSSSQREYQPQDARDVDRDEVLTR